MVTPFIALLEMKIALWYNEKNFRSGKNGNVECAKNSDQKISGKNL